MMDDVIIEQTKDPKCVEYPLARNGVAVRVDVRIYNSLPGPRFVKRNELLDSANYKLSGSQSRISE
jgi:hypothetical protein